jgi:hypothetical protein
MRNATDIIVLLDRSGSMATVKTDMEGGYKTYLEGLRAQPGEATVTLMQFDAPNLGNSLYTVGHLSPFPQSQDDWFQVCYTACPLAAAPALTLHPRGGTALLDAMSRAIDLTGERLRAMPEPQRPAKVLFITITDGEENSSVFTTTFQLRAKIEHQTGIYKWDFIYLGANQDSFAQAGAIGINLANVGNYQKTSGGIRGMYAAAVCSTNMTRSGGGAALPTDQDGNLPEQQPAP